MIAKFLGCEHVSSKFNGNTYDTYHLYCSIDIDDKTGKGVKPFDFKIKLNRYKEVLENCEEGTEFEISYEKAYDQNGKYKPIVTSLKF